MTLEPLTPNALAAIVVTVAAVGFIMRGVDVRLVLALGALPLFAIAGQVPRMSLLIAKEMANPGTIVPIGAALGFAYVLRLTGCDVHLVQLLLRPLRRVPWLLIPGGIAAGYLVNTVIVSQAGAVAVLGPVLVPLILAAGMSPVTAGSVLLLGCSMGGELNNPGAVEIVTLSALTELEPDRVVARVFPWNLWACVPALLAAWCLAMLHERGRPRSPADEDPSAGKARVPIRLNPFKAAVPLVPLTLLFLVPRLVDLPEELVGPPITLSALLIGVVAAALTSPRRVGGFASAFFEGAGYAYTHVISLIVTATLFAEAVKTSGLIDAMTSGLSRLPPVAAMLTGGSVAWGLATITGSGIAPAVAIMKAMVPAAESLGIDPHRLGALIALTAHFGRTMSPAAAVVFLSASLSRASAKDLIKRVIPPLLVGGAVLVLAAALVP